MFRTSFRGGFISSSRKSDRQDRFLKSEKRTLKKELLKKWNTKFFSPKITEETLPTSWIDSPKLKALAKAYETRKNLNRLTIIRVPKEIDSYSKFCEEKYQYYEVISKVPTVFKKLLGSQSSIESD